MEEQEQKSDLDDGAQLAAESLRLVSRTPKSSEIRFRLPPSSGSRWYAG